MYVYICMYVGVVGFSGPRAGPAALRGAGAALGGLRSLPRWGFRRQQHRQCGAVHGAGVGPAGRQRPGGELRDGEADQGTLRRVRVHCRANGARPRTGFRQSKPYIHTIAIIVMH